MYKKQDNEKYHKKIIKQERSDSLFSGKSRRGYDRGRQVKHT
jgi:hypothetical protein